MDTLKKIKIPCFHYQHNFGIITVLCNFPFWINFLKHSLFLCLFFLTSSVLAADVDQLYEKARSALNDNKYNEGLIHVKNILKTSPEHLATHILMTELLLANGSGSAAEVTLTKAIDLGADELDFVVNYEAFKRGEIDLVKNEITKGIKLSIDNNKVVKWIIEVAALTNKEIIVISQLIKNIVFTEFGEENASKVFVKSSTGFFITENNLPNGATFETMRLIAENSKPLKIKAAGGVRDYETAVKMVELGVDRIGTSSSKEIVNKEKNSNSGY